MSDVKTTDIQFLVGTVDSVNPENEKVYVSGMGDKAVFAEGVIGHKVMLSTGVSFLLPPHRKPDCLPGDQVFIEFRRSRHKGE